MPRIKKQGLDYFPMDTSFIHDRLVRRIMKQKGDAALSVLLGALSFIYSGEGYYVCADRYFYEDITDNLYEKTIPEVQEIIHLAINYGLFDAGLFAKHNILTSAEIQRQYLFSTKRRSISQLNPEYCLIENTELKPLSKKSKEVAEEKEKAVEKDECNNDDNATTENVTINLENVTNTPESVTFMPHSIAQHSIAEHSIAEHSVAEHSREYLLHPPFVGKEAEGENQGGGKGGGGDSSVSKATPSKHKEWTMPAIHALKPPENDGLRRNYEGLLQNLRHFCIPPGEQYALICKSNYGVIGHAVWKGFATLREANGKIKLPGRYLLSVVNK